MEKMFFWTFLLLSPVSDDLKFLENIPPTLSLTIWLFSSSKKTVKML